MTELDRAWAESQVEGMADGTLLPDAEERMLALMERDAELAARVEQAKTLRRELKQLSGIPMPKGLFWRLWRIPSQRHRRFTGLMWLPAGFIAAAASVALSINLFFGVQAPAFDEEAGAAAIEDFTLVMAYLQKSAVIATNEVNQAVGSGVLEAISVSRGMLDREETNVSEGD